MSMVSRTWTRRSVVYFYRLEIEYFLPFRFRACLVYEKPRMKGRIFMKITLIAITMLASEVRFAHGLQQGPIIWQESLTKG